MQVVKILTLQAYKWCRLPKIGQKFFIENSFHLAIEDRWIIWITTLILQLHPGVAPELIKFRKYRYHRNLQNPSCQFLFILKLCLNVPFLSGQISSKCFNSSDGRAHSNGTQYLKTFMNLRLNIILKREQTISHAIYSSIASPATCDTQNLAQSSTRLHCRPPFRESRGKHNRHDVRK